MIDEDEVVKLAVVGGSFGGAWPDYVAPVLHGSTKNISDRHPRHTGNQCRAYIIRHHPSHAIPMGR